MQVVRDRPGDDRSTGCILVTEGTVADGAMLRTGLEGLGLCVVGQAPDVVTAVDLARAARPDALIVDLRVLSSDAVPALRALREERVVPVLLYGASSDGDAVRLGREAGALAHVPRSCPVNELGPSIEVALAHWRQLCRLEQNLARIRAQLESRIVVERAKGILMDTLSLLEAEAFRTIQKLSMDSGKPMREVAEAILLAHQARRTQARTPEAEE